LTISGGTELAHMDRVVQVEVFDHGGEVVSVVVHVVPAVSLGGPPVTAPVTGDDPVAVQQEEHHLGVPVIGRQRPAMAEHDRLTFPPVPASHSTATPSYGITG
jgi:hypothetical protein